MQPWSRGFWISIGVAFLILNNPARSAVPERFDPADYAKPAVCPNPKYFKAKEGACNANTEEINKLRTDECKGPGLKLEGKTCIADNDKKPQPECKSLPGYTSKITGTGSEAACIYERTIPVSAPGDYVGDCFHVRAVPPGTGLTQDSFYTVTGQEATDDNDRRLTLVATEPSKYFKVIFGCGAPIGTPHRVLASQLTEAGASRRGYTYGFLTMPYKYYPSEKSFQANVPIGGYLGWRYGTPGSGKTIALAVTLSSVNANTVDPANLDASGKPTVTGTADVAALSYAVGIMFDILKSTAGKPFKAGFFVGKDVVNSDPNIDYRFNRKTWYAIQLGYDFTDN
jgi:hypothetical protein